MSRRLSVVWLSLVLAAPLMLCAAQNGLESSAPPQRIEPPSPSMSLDDLEIQGDTLRDQKAFRDANDYYRAALQKAKGDKSRSAVLYNKMGIAELQMTHYSEATKNFSRAIKNDKTYAEAFNNRGVVYYTQKKYGKAIKEYKKALVLRDESASFHSNLGSAYFSEKKFELAAIEYNRALQLDADIFERNSKGGVAAHLRSPEDRAHFSFVLAKMYAQLGNFDRSLLYLRRAMEDGYKEIDEVYKDQEFSKLREDKRFAELMAAKPVSIPQ
jgi:tetratricopeptide (TPR) repeat protein